MWAKVKADQVIEVFNGAKAITDSNGVQHPSSIFSNWSKDELANIGFYPVNQATPADIRFYRNGAASYSFSDGVVTETISSTALDINNLITNYKINIDNQAYNMLQPSDWMAVRQYETTKAAEMRTAVSAVTSVGELKDLHVVYDTDSSIASGILYNFGEPPTE